MKFTFFLGAGASSLFRFPTTKKFLEKANKQIENDLFSDILVYLRSKKDEQADIEEVLWELKNLKSFASEFSQGQNIESWFFTERKNVEYRDKSRDHSTPLLDKLNELSSAVDDTVDQINKLVYETYWDTDKPSNSDIYTKIYDKFGPGIDFFTTNYDLIIEYSFGENESYKNIIYDGFKPEYDGLKWNEDGFKKSEVRLYKLHGSVNWRRGKDGLIYKTPQKENHNRNAIIYPGFKGEPETEPFIYLHDEFENNLLETDVLIAIGFAFRDKAINDIILKSLKQNKRLKLLIWNPLKPQNPFPKDRVNYLSEKFNIESLEKLEKRYKVRKLFKVASEFEVSTQSIIDTLADEGFDIAARPNSTITPEMYQKLEHFYD